LANGQLGWCHTRENRNGILFTLIHGLVTSLSANPIEKKPLHHFYPGSVALTAGSYSCNFACPWCQNWDISKQSPSDGRYMSPEEFVAEAIRQGCRGTSISFNEPTLSLEWSLELFRTAHQAGLYNTFVTNGYMTTTALEHLAHAGLDGMNVDVKGDAQAVRTHCQSDVEVVWRNLRRAREMGIWVEVTTLVIPGVNDDTTTLRTIAGRIRDSVGPETPWHVTRYRPAFVFSAPPTRVNKLEQARQIGLQAGLTYVYIGNVLGHTAESTFCPTCEQLLIQRSGMYATSNYLQAVCCPSCGQEVAGVGLDWAE
jgi:pyruvate formate lyase activating enzyme